MNESEHDVTQARFLDHLAQGRLMLPLCLACARLHFPPRVLCPHCGAATTAFREASGRGVVYSTTVVRNRPEKGGDFNVALIELDEGPRLMSSVVDCAATEVRIGMRVSLDRARLAAGDVRFARDAVHAAPGKP